MKNSELDDNSHTTLDPPSVNLDASGEIPEDPRIVEVVEEYLAQLEQGQTPDRSAFVARYPELAEAIAQCLDGLEIVRAGFPGRSRSMNDAVAGAFPHPGADCPPDPLGDFQIVRELGRGGMGVVYEAVQLSLGRRVALKVLPFAAMFDARQLHRFRNEAQAAAMLHHTHIVPVYSVGSERGVHFYAMQLIEGQSLAVVIKQLRSQAGLDQAVGASTLTKRPSEAGAAPSAADLDGHEPGGSHDSTPSAGLRATANVSASITEGSSRERELFFRRIARLMVQAADALEHAHQMGVIHRDIKPGNLLVNGIGNLWITDFGLAQFHADTGLTRSGDLMGTFRYMSPEQTSGQRTMLDHRSDIYSLGATFYELLTLEPVFAGETRQELLYQIIHNEPRPPRALNKVVPLELETIVLKALSKTPAERYNTAGEFAADVQRFLDNKPILARPPSLLDRGRKWSRRHPSAVVAGMLLLAITTVGLSASHHMISQEQKKTADALNRENKRADEAEDSRRQARRAVDVLIEVSEEELAGKWSMQRTRKRMLLTALTYYQDFVEQRRGDAASQAELAGVQTRVKGILYELNLLQRDMQIELLRNPVVLADLSLTDRQDRRLTPLLQTWADERAAFFEGIRDRSEESRHRWFVETAEYHERELADVLTPAQRARLTQISIQSQWLSAFMEPEVAQLLELTAAQRAAIRTIERETWPQRRGKDDHHGRSSLNVHQAVAMAVELLTADQAARWEKLIGPPCVGLDAPRPPQMGSREGRAPQRTDAPTPKSDPFPFTKDLP